MHIKEQSTPSFYEYSGKRIFDIVTALILIVLSCPLFIITALIIFVTSGGPVLFAQTRVGKKGQLFTIWKFRTMKKHHHKEQFNIKENDGVPNDFLFKSGKDCRVTKVGAILRKYSIDELPQLFNVLIKVTK